MRRSGLTGLRILVHISVLLPLAILAWDFFQGRLTANPIQEITLRTGKYTLILLLLSLACTPLNTLFGLKWVLRLRRSLGLYAFMYASFHFLNFVGVDYRFDFLLLGEDIAEKLYVLAGFAAFISLLLLALTSTQGWKRRLGKSWKHLHWLAYVAIALAVTHFAWQVKADFREPLMYGAIVALLLIVRIPLVKSKIDISHRRLKAK